MRVGGGAERGTGKGRGKVSAVVGGVGSGVGEATVGDRSLFFDLMVLWSVL